MGIEPPTPGLSGHSLTPLPGIECVRCHQGRKISFGLSSGLSSLCEFDKDNRPLLCTVDTRILNCVPVRTDNLWMLSKQPCTASGTRRSTCVPVSLARPIHSGYCIFFLCWSNTIELSLIRTAAIYSFSYKRAISQLSMHTSKQGRIFQLLLTAWH